MGYIIKNWKVILISIGLFFLIFIGVKFYEKISNIFNFSSNDTITNIESNINNYKTGINSRIEQLDDISTKAELNNSTSEETIIRMGEERSKLFNNLSELTKIRKEVNNLTNRADGINTDLSARIEYLKKRFCEYE